MSESQWNNLNLDALRNTTHSSSGSSTESETTTRKGENEFRVDGNTPQPVVPLSSNQVDSSPFSDPSQKVKEKNLAISKISLEGIKKNVHPLSKSHTSFDNNKIPVNDSQDVALWEWENTEPSIQQEEEQAKDEKYMVKNEDNLLDTEKYWITKSENIEQQGEKIWMKSEWNQHEWIIENNTVKVTQSDVNEWKSEDSIKITNIPEVETQEIDSHIWDTLWDSLNKKTLPLEYTVSTEWNKDIRKNTLRQSWGLLWFLKGKKKESIWDSIDSNSKVEEWSKEDKKDEEVHFENYTSSFEEQNHNLLTKIQKFKYTPSTRKWLVMTLILFAVWIMGALMTFFPQIHSISIYKANMLEIVSPQKIHKDPNSNINTTTVPLGEIKNDTIISENEIGKLENDKQKIKDYIINKYNANR